VLANGWKVLIISSREPGLSSTNIAVSVGPGEMMVTEMPRDVSDWSLASARTACSIAPGKKIIQGMEG
jgi:hypothetical protein